MLHFVLASLLLVFSSIPWVLTLDAVGHIIKTPPPPALLAQIVIVLLLQLWVFRHAPDVDLMFLVPIHERLCDPDGSVPLTPK